jgi:hypothetical protein
VSIFGTEQSRAKPWSQSDKLTEAEAGNCATLRANGTGSRAVPWLDFGLVNEQNRAFDRADPFNKKQT